MKKVILILTIYILVGTSFASGQTLLKMIALEEFANIKKGQLAETLNDDWGFKLDSSEIEWSETAIAFELEGEMVGIINMDIAIPFLEYEGPCKYAFQWPDAAEQMKKQKAHLITTIMTAKGSTTERLLLLTKLTSSLLKLSKPIGIYMGNQQLVISSENYQVEAKRIKEDLLPVANWVLLGLARKDDKTTAFTIGLSVLGYKEFEIIKSDKELDETYFLLYNTVHYVVESDVKFKNRETIGFSENQKINVKTTSSELFKGEKVLLLEY